MRGKSPAVDMVKTYAVFSVIGVHFVLHTQVAGATFTRENIVLFGVVYHFFIVCVPLFLLATGYLQVNKLPTKNYFQKLWQLLITYVSISVITGIYRIIILKEAISAREFMYQLLTFKLNSYSWYVNMFIGLFLFVPYINVLLNQLTKKQIQVFIGIGIGLISLPELINSIPLFQGYLALPNYWRVMYPILYIVIGYYLKKHHEVNLIREIAVGILMLVLGLGIDLFYSEATFTSHIGYYGSFIILLQAISFYVILFEIGKGFKNTYLKKVIRFISTNTLEIYLFSNIVDLTLYPYWNRHFPNNGYLSTGLIILVNVLSAVALSILYKIAINLLKQMRPKQQKIKTRLE